MVSRRLVDASALELISQGAGETVIRSALLGMGAALCVAQDWATEPRRREWLQANYAARKSRYATRGLGRIRPGTAYRHVINVKVETGREVVLHATKGRRSFRASKMS